jgi:hypothetical protein
MVSYNEKFWVHNPEGHFNGSVNVLWENSYGIILVGNQIGAQFILWYFYLNPVHVSSNTVLILGRTIILIQLPV